MQGLADICRTFETIFHLVSSFFDEEKSFIYLKLVGFDFTDPSQV